MREATSYVAAFVAERCNVGDKSTKSVSVDDLYSAFCRWLGTQGNTRVPDRQQFGLDLHAACVGLERVQRRRADSGRRQTYYFGIELKPGPVRVVVGVENHRP